MGCSKFKLEFTKRLAGLCDCLEPCFSSSMWFRNPLPLLIFRLIVFLPALTLMINNIIHHTYAGGHFQLTYFTVWTFWVLIFYFGFGFVSSVMALVKRRKAEMSVSIRMDDAVGNEDKEPPLMPPSQSLIVYEGEAIDCLPWYNKAQWVLFNIIVINAFLVTGIYWGILYPFRAANNYKVTVSDASTHAVNSVVIAIEIILNAIPVRVLHFYHPILYGASYLIFTTIYWAVDYSNVVYAGLLDWNQPTVMAIVIISINVYYTVGFALYYGLYRLKVFLYAKYYKSSKDVLQQTCAQC